MKIDKSFTDRLGASHLDSATLVTAAVAMGHGLGLTVVTEGVETPAQAALLAGVGCDLLQAYLLSKPLPAEALGPLLHAVLLPAAGSIPAPRAVEPMAMHVPAVLPTLPR
ncbi:MAG: EAL domain-containing protein [Actinobacteria bacterium]|nr:EAL domain-containing protein [Actinomycetota bacterium]MBW3647255.1 EAL domain-containing protein [Actinomycetota bacterium]